MTEEFRVNFKGGREATAYYTNDLDDAARTGVYMAQTRGTPKAYSGRIIFDGYLGKFQNVADDGTVLNQANTAEQAEAFGKQTK